MERGSAALPLLSGGDDDPQVQSDASREDEDPQVRSDDSGGYDDPQALSETRSLIPSLQSSCRNLVVANLERYEPKYFSICDVVEWGAIVRLYLQRAQPQYVQSLRLKAIMPSKVLTDIMAAYPHLAASPVADRLLYQNLVDHTFPRGGATRPRELYRPWPVLVEQLKQEWSLWSKRATDLRKQQLQVLYSTAWNRALLRDTGLERIVKDDIQHWSPGPHRDALQEVLEFWERMAAETVEAKVVYVPFTETRALAMAGTAAALPRALTLPRGDTSRPPELDRPCPVQVERLKQEWSWRSKSATPSHKQLLKVLHSTAWNVALLRDTGMERIVKDDIQHWTPGPHRDSLQEVLESWERMAAETDAAKAVYVPFTKSRKIVVADIAADLQRAERATTWKQLFDVLQERKAEREAAQKVRMRQWPQKRVQRVPKLVEIRPLPTATTIARAA